MLLSNTRWGKRKASKGLRSREFDTEKHKEYSGHTVNEPSRGTSEGRGPDLAHIKAADFSQRRTLRGRKNGHVREKNVC